MADKERFYEAVAMLIGMTIGAGILGIPYVVAQSGFLIGALLILAIGAVVLIVNLCMGEVCLRTKGNHQLTGYAEKYLGKPGKILMLVSIFVGFYGALIAYIIGEGESLGALFSYNPLILSILFASAMSALLFFGIKTVGKSELFMTATKIILFAAIIFITIFAVRAENLTSVNLLQIFLPYGVILFAFTGSAAIPEMKEVMLGQGKNLRRAIYTGMIIISIIYLLFAFIVVGASGKEVTEVASIGLAKIVGGKMLILGSLFAILAMATSYIAVGLALKETYVYDLKMEKIMAWFLTVSIPLLAYLLLYVFNLMSFITIIGISGAISGCISLALIMLIHQKAKKKGDREPEYSMRINKVHAYLIIFFLVFATLAYLVHII